MGSRSWLNISLAKPDMGLAAFVADNATVLGNVAIAEGASIWYGAIVRGDLEKIQLGRYSNVQDGAVLHGDPGIETVLEDYVTIGHKAVVHSAHIETGSLIGIGAIILDGVRIGAGSIIGAGCVVTKDVPRRSLMVGIPAKKIKTIDDAKADGLIEHAKKYYQLALRHSEETS